MTIPLTDLHCHLLAGLDDGPRTEEDAVAMCRLAYADGTRAVLATAHQNERWQSVTPERIRQGVRRLALLLHQEGVGLAVFPGAEVMAHVEVEACWRNGELLSVADRGQYLLLEMPGGLFVDLRDTAARLRRAGVSPILAHPERHPELLHETGRIEELVHAGCLVQVSSGSVTQPASRRDERALKGWFRRGSVHVIGSDGHSPHRRPPGVAAAYHRIAHWTGDSVADRICSTNGTAILHGLPLRVPEPPAKRRAWIGKFW